MSVSVSHVLRVNNTFLSDSGQCAKELLKLVHSDACGKVNTKSLGGAEYFLTFIDDKSRYV